MPREEANSADWPFLSRVAPVPNAKHVLAEPLWPINNQLPGDDARRALGLRVWGGGRYL